MRTFILAGAFAVLVTGCQDKPVEKAPGAGQPAEPRPLAPAAQQPGGQQPAAQQPGGQQPAAQQPGGPAPGTTGPAAAPGPLVACRPGADVEEAASRLVEMADTNQDGKVSQDETRALTNFVLGGFFFRADANGDGTVTPEEGRDARAELESRYPTVATLLRGVRGATGKSPFATLATLLDVQYGKPLTMAEARDAARGAVADLYAVADADKDGAITLDEARNAARHGTQALAQAAFRAADTDRNGTLSVEELQSAAQTAVRSAFTMADTNKDARLSEQEAATAMARVTSMLGTTPPAVQ